MIVFVFLLGKLVIWTLQTQAVFDPIRKIKFIQEMLMCDFCTGFWVYLVFALLFGQALTAPLPWNPATLLLEALLDSYIMHLVSRGFSA